MPCESRWGHVEFMVAVCGRVDLEGWVVGDDGRSLVVEVDRWRFNGLGRKDRR